MTQTQTPFNSAASTKPDTQEFFDELMASIEPDLTSENVPYLETRYIGETVEQRAKRMDRYNAAFDTFNYLLQNVRDSAKEYEGAAHAAVAAKAYPLGA